jgi:cysteine sulfinate desulfinase/cysteine desulfurase-like protein
LADEALKAMNEALINSGNPSGLYQEARKARDIVEDARRSVAQLINCTARRIVFTSGGSEANNMAIKGIAFKNHNDLHIVTSQIEHPSVLSACQWLEKHGASVAYLPVDGNGQVNPDDLIKAINRKTRLITIMTANNETGVIQPIRELAMIAREREIIFHTDSVQAVGKISVDVEVLVPDLLTMSAHKFNGPKGIGCLYIRKGVELVPLIHGGGQESGLRAGTENVSAIAGLGKAAELAESRLNSMESVMLKRNRIEKAIQELAPLAKVNGHQKERLPNTLNITLPGFRGESLALALDQAGVAISSGSACKSGSPKPSQALLAMGLTEQEAHCSIRISLGPDTTDQDIDYALDAFGKIIKESKEIVRFAPCR